MSSTCSFRRRPGVRKERGTQFGARSKMPPACLTASRMIDEVVFSCALPLDVFLATIGSPDFVWRPQVARESLPLQDLRAPNGEGCWGQLGLEFFSKPGSINAR